MTKENFINKWASVYNVNDTTNPYFIADLESVIANEIAKVQEAKPEEAKPQPDFNPIEEAYEQGLKIRRKNWDKNAWIQKLSETESTSDTLTTFANNWDFEYFPDKWEIYTEPDQEPDQVTDQVKPAKPFNKDRFEAMFRAVVASGEKLDFEYCKRETTYFIQQLDAYYASKEGGNND